MITMGEVLDLAGLDESERFEKFVERAGTAWHNDESVRIFYQECLIRTKNSRA